MIGKVLGFLKNQLNVYLELKSGRQPTEATEDIVVFLKDTGDATTFELGAVSVLLINVEKENILRSADPFTTVDSNGVSRKVQPEIRLNLYVLFVAHFNQYEEGLTYLSLIIKYFLRNRLFNHHNTPALSDEVEQLVMELVTLPFSEQNEVWNALRTAYLPSVLYKVKMVVFRDEDTVPTTEITEKAIRIAQ